VESLPLIANGIPTISLRLRANATAVEEFAADDLYRQLCRIAGTKACLRTGDVPVHLNDAEAAEEAGIDVTALALGSDDYHLETRNGALFLLGGGPRGVLYAVSALLERVGCRWFTPEVEQIPRFRELALPALVETGRPAFTYREQFYWDTKDPLWRVRNRINGSPEIPEYLGGSLHYGLWAHTFFQLLGPEEYFPTHPEFFSMIGGVRRRDANQFCLTNPQLPRVFAERLLQRMRENPAAGIWSVSQTDGPGYCECPACAALAEAEGAQSGPLLHFVNQVANLVADEFPDKWIDTLAYQWSVDAPRHLRPAANVRVRLCSYGCCQAHPFGACAHPESARFLTALEGWSAIAAGRLDIWHYSTNYGHYLLPMPDFDELAGNFQRFHRLGVRGIFAQGQGDEGGGAELSALRGYVISRLLWNPNQPVWPLVDEFLPAYYGAAAGAVRRYLDLFHGAVRRDPTLHTTLGDSPSSPLYDPARMQEADAILITGEGTVRGVARQRVRQLRSGLGYARLHTAVQGFRLEGNRYRNDAGPAERKLLQTLVTDWQRSGVEALSECTRLHDTLATWKNRLSAHRVAWLRDDEMAVAVVPSLGGRLLELHAGGRQWLMPPGPGEYPCPEGYAEVSGFISGSVEPYTCRRQGEWLCLEGIAGNGLMLNRRLRLKDGVLRIESRMWNPTAVTMDCSWGGGFRIDPGGLKEARVIIGGAVECFDAAQIPADGTLAFERERFPSDGWEVDYGPDGVLRHRFGGEALYRAALGCNAWRPGLSLYLCTNLLQLPPAGAISVWQELDVRIKN